MAEDIKRVGLEFTAEGVSDFKSQLQAVTQASQENYKAFKKAKEGYDSNTSASKKLGDRQKYLTSQTEAYKKKLNSIPEKERCEVHPQVGTPIVDKLTYTTSEEIADMFTSLLASDSDNRLKQYVHPSFVGIIENLSPDEARIIKYFKGKETIEFCSFRGILKSNGGFLTLLDHATNILTDVELSYPNNTGAYISNLVRLGFLVEPQGVHLNDKTGYNRIRETYGLEKLRKELVPNEYKSLECKEGYYLVTPFGKLFIKAVFPDGKDK